MDWNVFILGMCFMAIFLNVTDFFDDIVIKKYNIIYNIIILTIILLISIGRIIKLL